MLVLLSEIGMLACKPIEISMQNHHLAIYHSQSPTNKEKHQRIAERLIYLSFTRPYIAYVVSQFMHSSSEEHMAANAYSKLPKMSTQEIVNLQKTWAHGG